MFKPLSAQCLKVSLCTVSNPLRETVKEANGGRTVTNRVTQARIYTKK